MLPLPADVLRAALERGPTRPSTAVDDGGLKLFADEMSARMRAGDEVRAWDDLQLRFRWMPDEAAATATQRLAREDLGLLLDQFSSAGPLAVQMLVPFVPWSDDLGDRWLRASCSRAVAALGVVLWLRSVPPVFRPTSEGDEAAFDTVLVHVQDGLAARPRAEEVALWWQALGVAYRVCGSTSPGVPPRMRALYERAAAALARTGGIDAIPSSADFRLWASGNPELGAVLPLVAHRANEDKRAALLQAFFADAERRLEGELPDLPDLARPGGLLYVNACGHAIAMEVSKADPAPWWKVKLGSYVEKLSGWHGDPTPAAMERAAWVACAASIAALKLASASDDAWKPLLSDLRGKVEPHVADWLWELGYPASARIALQELLVRAACLDKAAAPELVMRIAHAARDSSALGIIKREAALTLPTSAVEEIERLIAQRSAYENALGLGVAPPRS